MPPPSPAPGWYPDPSNPQRSIYWDGVKWTGQMRGPAPPQGRTKSRDAGKWVAAGVVGFIGLVALASHHGHDSKPRDELHLPPVRDGKLEFTLLAWNGKAGTMRIVNIGKGSWSYDGSNQKAIDAQGRQFDCDGGTAKDIQPGGEYIDSLTCRNGDVPVYSLKVHDSWLSFGTDLLLKPSSGT